MPRRAIGLFLALVTGCLRSHLDLGADATTARTRILAAVPTGTSLADAERAMTREGFTCEPKRDAAFLDREHLDYLYCDRSDSEGFAVSRRWQVALVTDGERVSDVIVSTGLIGP